jgi:hypothetical protein
VVVSTQSLGLYKLKILRLRFRWTWRLRWSG